MKIDKISLDGKKNTLEINDKIFVSKINKKLISEILYKISVITKVEKQRQNKKTKLLDQLQKYMLKRALVMQDTQVEKHQYLLVEELHMVQKVNYHIKQES